MADVLGDRPAAVGRELTKTFEEIRLGTLRRWPRITRRPIRRRARSSSASARRGAGPTGRRRDIDRLLLSLAAEMPASKAAAEAARMTGGRSPTSTAAAGAEAGCRPGLTPASPPQGLSQGPSRRMAGGLALMLKGYRILAGATDALGRDRPDRPARRPRAHRRGQGAADAEQAMEAVARQSERRIEAAAESGCRGRRTTAVCRCASTSSRSCPGAGRCMWRTYSTGRA